MSLALLGRFRAQWPDSPLPMVVEHFPGAPEHICAAPSLWMGGRSVASALREAGLGPGHRVVYAGSSRVGFVQALVGALRAGVCFDGAPRQGTRPSGFIFEDLTVQPVDLARRDDGERLLAFGDGVALGPAELEALAVEGAAVLAGPHQRVGSDGDWSDWRRFGAELLGALGLGLELHVIHPGVSAAELEARGCLPQVVLCATRPPWLGAATQRLHLAPVRWPDSLRLRAVSVSSGDSP